MRLALPMLAVAALAACATPMFATRITSPKHVEAAKLLIREELRNPASAVWGGNITFKMDNGAITVCQFVNAENAYGGMTGEEPVAVNFMGDRYTGMFFGERAITHCGQLVRGSPERT